MSLPGGLRTQQSGKGHPIPSVSALPQYQKGLELMPTDNSSSPQTSVVTVNYRGTGLGPHM